MKYLGIIVIIAAALRIYFSNNTTPSSTIAPTQQVILSPPKTGTATPKNTPIPSPTPSQRIIYPVAFMSQSPFAQWNDPRQQDGCEEASVLMAMHWVRGDSLLPKQQAFDELMALSKFSEEQYGTFHDTSSSDTVKFFNDYFDHDGANKKSITNANDIVKEIRNGNLVIIPSNGRKLLNPHFTAPGPEYHMLIVIGFDESTKEFVTNDPGMSTRGVSYRYPYSVLFDSIADYETGQHIPRTSIEKNIIVVSK